MSEHMTMKRLIKLITKKDCPPPPKDDIKKINICGGTLRINNTLTKKIMEARYADI